MIGGTTGGSECPHVDFFPFCAFLSAYKPAGGQRKEAAGEDRVEGGGGVKISAGVWGLV